MLPIPASLPPELIIVNGTLEQRLVLEVAEDSGSRQLHIYDCRGHSVQQRELTLNAGLHSLTVPPAGIVTLIAR